MESLAKKQDELLMGNYYMVVPLVIPPPLELSSQESAVSSKP